jgi:hypothetical protein
MNPLPQPRDCKSADKTLFAALILGSCFLCNSLPVLASGGLTNVSEKIECITPDGRVTPISNAEPRRADMPATVTGQDTISCNLQEGETTFIIPFPKTGVVDRFTFINKNTAACGEFNIAVSNSRLSPASGQWIDVDGVVPFAHKRLFNLSMVGIEAKYVKLAFHVEKHSRVTGADHQRNDKQSSGASIKLVAVAPPAAGPGEQ